ncbi:hypothetical protein MCOR21_003247 [Pyricularia oryzae]|nr:hypothetical protein MCOR26_000822 [Pyricularia oryzae]KAI6432618.1 hypothetical protein MCOR21_003247 [Pyricularia oryzae]KAI6476841.1 hypothetical protein MCOR17_000867 [Pyricularia oryzae]QBZ62886.1 hypothetical protein PoMZ_11774 [Pyricularia oryzae]
MASLAGGCLGFSSNTGPQSCCLMSRLRKARSRSRSISTQTLTNRDSSEGYTDERGKREAIKTQAGYFLDEDLGCIDTSFFSMGRKEVERCDPRQRQLLEVAREAFNSASEAEFCGKSIGCCVGTFSEDCLQLLLDLTAGPKNSSIMEATARILTSADGAGDGELSVDVTYGTGSDKTVALRLEGLTLTPVDDGEILQGDQKPQAAAR